MPALFPRSAVPGLWAVNADGRERPIVTDVKGGMPSAAVGSVRRALRGGRTLHLAGANAQFQPAPTSSVQPQWLPGNELRTAGGRIWRFGLGQSYSRDGAAVPEGGSTFRGAVAFTAKVSLQRTTYTIAHRPLEPAEPQKLTGIVNPVVSPDGGAIAFTAMGDLFVMPVGGAPVQITNDSAMEIDPAWSPDSSRIAFASDRGGQMDLWVHDLARNRSERLTESHGAVSGPAWSPDGNHIAFVVDHRAPGVVDLQRDSHRFSFFPSPPGEIGRPTWSADSNSIAVGALFPYSSRYREGLNQILLLSNAAAPRRPLSAHSATDRQTPARCGRPTDSGWPSSAKARVYGAGGRARRRHGPALAVATDQPESPSWEGNSKHIVYQTPRGLRRIVADGSLPEPIPLDLTWRNGSTPNRIVVHAGHVLDGVPEAIPGEADIVIQSGVINSIEPHRAHLHTGAVVDAPTNTDAGLLEMHASRRRHGETSRVVACESPVRIPSTLRRARAARGVRRRPSAWSSRVPGR